MNSLRHFFVVLLILCIFYAPGCAPLSGAIYTHVQTPYTENLHNSPFIESPANHYVIKIKEPISGLGLYTEFDSNAIGDIARKNGLACIHFADLETFSLLGVWTQANIIVYGQKDPCPDVVAKTPLL
jgi:hypothetical protein